MPNIVDRFGQLVDDAIPKPELARQLLLLGYRAKDVQLLLAPEKELTPARQYAAQIAMDAMIAPLAHPQRAALVNIFMPCELLHAFHLLPMFAEATACYLNGAAAERGFIHYAESAGISPTLCSYHKALLGMGLSGTAGKPLFTACTSIACDANNLTFRRLAQHYGIPHFYLDVPYGHDEYAVAEVSDRLREFAAFLEDATHQKLDEAALQQAVAHSSRTLELLQQAQAAKAGRNLHNDVTSEFYEVFVTHTMLGTPQAEQYARKLLADIEGKLNDWCADSGGLLLGYDRDRYLFVMEEKDFSTYAEKKFDVLDSVRTVESGGVSATLSIGVGRDGDSFDGLFKNADLALEMALSRGGDQAVVKDRNNFEFYGGRSKTTEKRTKVKSRVMANALRELVQDARNVYVMGHKYADMDSLGAAAGICCISRKLGKKAQIVIDTENNAAHPVLRALQQMPEYAGVFVAGETAFLHAQPDTLLVVVDTNRPDSVESEPLLESCTRVAVIDHHRRGSSYIDKMTLNYHEPYASSASELVTELMQYLLEPTDILKCEAEALLAGVVLDTKNFTNRTGGRTFEAAAYLRRAGADTQDVQRMFQSDLDAMVTRYAIMRQAQIYHGDIAVVAADEAYDRVTAAKAADELLTIRGIRASFVLYRKDDGVYMSARSLGEVNVQVILEALGGGGNSTTAGGQAKGITVAEAKEKLLAAIDQYFED